MTKITPIPDGFTNLIPYLTCKDAAKAIAFYGDAFGATVLQKIPTSQGLVMHATLKINDAILMVTDEMPEWCNLGPLELGGSPVGIHTYWEDVEAAFARAVRAGCEVTMPLDDTFWGERFGMLKDPYGHKWSLSMRIRDVADEEVTAAALQVC